jgi:hypothetical protein
MNLHIQKSEVHPNGRISVTGPVRVPLKVIGCGVLRCLLRLDTLHCWMHFTSSHEVERLKRGKLRLQDL